MVRISAYAVLIAFLVPMSLAGCERDGDESPTVTFGGQDSTQSAPPADEIGERETHNQPDSTAPSDHRLPAPEDSPPGAAPGQHTQQRHIAELPPGTEQQRAALNEGRTAFVADRYREAEDIFEPLAFDEPITADTISAAVALGQIYIETGRPGEALELFDELEDHVSEIPEVLLILARTYEELDENDRAIEAYDRAYDQKRDYIFILPEMAQLLVAEDRKEEAGQIFWRYEQNIEELVGHLGDIDSTTEHERVYIADIFALLSDARAHEALEQTLDEDPSQRVRIQAAVALGEGVAFDARDTLEQTAVEDESEPVRRAARRALETLRDFEEQFDRPD